MIDTNFYKNNGPFTLQQVAEICGAVVQDSSKSSIFVSEIATMENAQAGDICFFYDKKAKEKAKDIKASACITTQDLAPNLSSDVVILISSDPKLAFLKLNEKFYSEYLVQIEISTSAKIHSSAKIGKDCFIGENVVIEENVVIGDNCVIGHNVVIARSCQIGNNTRIDSGATVAYAKIGNNCFIYSGARIGCDGFGFMFLNGQHKRIPQIGRVIIGNDVEVGANSCVDRGAMDDTVIGDGCRFDNFVQVAHNVKMGRSCIMVSQSGIAGSCNIGDYVVIGGQVGIGDHVNVGSGSQIASQSGVMRDVAPQEVVWGTPAVPIKQQMRQVAYLQKAASVVNKNTK